MSMKTRIIFILLWITFITGAILIQFKIPGGLISMVLSGLALTLTYFIYPKRILMIPKGYYKNSWLIYLSGIIWGYCINSLFFIVNVYPGVNAVVIMASLFLLALLIVNVVFKSRLSDNSLFIRIFIHSILLLAIIIGSYYLI